MEHKRIKNLTLKNLLARFLTLASILMIVTIGFLQPSYADEANKSAITNSLFSNDSEDEFLSPDVAFKLNLSATDAASIQAAFTVAPGYYLYRERIKFIIQPATDGAISGVTLPAGEIKNDPNFGRQEVYHHDFNANIKLASIKNSALTIAATYQGCSEKGLCYAPIKKTFTVDFPTAGSGINNANTQAVDDNDTDITKVLKSGNLWLVIAGFFAAGLLLSLTPCVLPMIPILSSIIVGSQSKQVKPSKLHAFGLSVAYVLGMALSYTLAGVAAGLSGSLLSQSLQNPWVLGVTAMLFVGFALSMFGFYELRLPVNFESKLMNSSNKLKGGEFLGVFTMGILSALIVSPCVAAPLAGALIYIGQTHNVLLGGVGLFALAIGMGMPLLLIGASAGSLLPKTGNWMNTVRNFFGTLMLGMAIWLISPVIPTSIQLGLWAALFIVNAIYLNALDSLPTHLSTRANNFAKFWKGIAVILLLVGVALLIGALSGAKSIRQPFSGFNNSILSTNNNQQKNESSLAFNRITSIAELDKKLAETKGQPVMLDFYADWCVACKELEEYTFSDPKVQQLLKNTVLLQVDVTANSEEDKALLKRFALYGPPGIVFFNKNGEEMTTIKTVGFQDANRFMTTLAKRDSCIMPINKELTVQC
ncbi:MAG: protein-disulfide reductase DsbD [Methylotenera sp.]